MNEVVTKYDIPADLVDFFDDPPLLNNENRDAYFNLRKGIIRDDRAHEHLRMDLDAGPRGSGLGNPPFGEAEGFAGEHDVEASTVHDP